MYLAHSSEQIAFHDKQNIITSIYAEELLGYYTYTINSENNGRLLIIYGDNGSGKTTLLKLVYHLLSSEVKKGHKSILANARFKKISVTLSDGTIISAKRDNNGKGDFTFSVKNKFNKKSNLSCFLKVHEKGNALSVHRDEDETNPAFGEIMRAIKELNLSLYFLQDDRDLLTASTNKRKSNAFTRHEMLFAESELYFSTVNKEETRKDKQRLLIEDAFTSLNTWINKKVIAYSNIGESNNQNIYLDLVKSIFLNTKDNTLKSEKSNELISQLEGIAILNQNLANIGLVASFDYYSLIDIVKEVNNHEKFLLINNILMPFIEGSTAKLNALSEIYNIITLFISNVNDFFYDKSISYHLNEGFSVLHYNGDVVQMYDLSSGEKHLLHLWINSIIAEDATIFIIDEPEISLNIKWQRRLLDSLLSYTKERKIQFIIATHSIELLANNSNSVVKLVNQNSLTKK